MLVLGEDETDAVIDELDVTVAGLVLETEAEGDDVDVARAVLEPEPLPVFDRDDVRVLFAVPELECVLSDDRESTGDVVGTGDVVA